mgnify:CR=1 FL=1|tara:strand:- start:54396 stop:54563 length:168 start_codon:yes stop_codon:yes gene_type:complete
MTSLLSPTQQAYEDGWDAFNDGQTKDSNPESGEDERQGWTAGWKAASKSNTPNEN